MVGEASPLFFGNSRKVLDWGLALSAGAFYVAPRRGTESQRARPPRCEAAPPRSRLSRKARLAKGSSSGAGPRRFRSSARGCRASGKYSEKHLYTLVSFR